jgi:GNAT superfamily N-acetyltransferase
MASDGSDCRAPGSSSSDDLRRRLECSLGVMSDADPSATLRYTITPPLSSLELNQLFVAAWPAWVDRDWVVVLERSLAYVCAYESGGLIGFVNLAWDGGVHGFLLDTTVHSGFRRRGIGRALVGMLVDVARKRDLQYVHVDFEAQLLPFYRNVGFAPTEAGLIRLHADPA